MVVPASCGNDVPIGAAGFFLYDRSVVGKKATAMSVRILNNLNLLITVKPLHDDGDAFRLEGLDEITFHSDDIDSVFVKRTGIAFGDVIVDFYIADNS